MSTCENFLKKSDSVNTGPNLQVHYTSREKKEKEKEQKARTRCPCQTREKEEPHFRVFRVRENMKYIVKIQGKQFKKTFLPISKALESFFTLFC